MRNLNWQSLTSPLDCVTVTYQGWEPAESQLYAEHDRGPDRVGSVVLRVPASPPTANLQIILSGTLVWMSNLCVSGCVCASDCVWTVKNADRRNLQLWCTMSVFLSGEEPHLCQASPKWLWFATKNHFHMFFLPLLSLPSPATDPLSRCRKKNLKKAQLWWWWWWWLSVSDWMNQCLFS